MAEAMASASMKGGLLAGLVVAIIVFTVVLIVLLVGKKSPDMTTTAGLVVGSLIVGGIAGYLVGR
ncbi:MAG: hypothetical protein ACYDDF_01125 [Thermoplasmatota archaeon]